MDSLIHGDNFVICWLYNFSYDTPPTVVRCRQGLVDGLVKISYTGLWEGAGLENEQLCPTWEHLPPVGDKPVLWS
jgi:hypothetical protein